MTARATRQAQAVPPLAVALFALVCVLGLWRVVATLFLHVPFDPNEGWNAYHAAAAMAGQPLYPDAKTYFVNNYPPLSFYLVGAFGNALGDNIVAGRLVSLLSFSAIAIGIFLAVREMGGRLVEALFAALVFAAWLLVCSDYVGMDDPQMLGHALDMVALLLVLGTPRREIAAALVFVAALFVKHNLVAMPIAVGAWLLLEDRARALRFIAAGIGFALAGVLAFRLAYGSSLFSHLASARVYSYALLAQNAGAWLVWGAIPVLLVAALGWLERKERFVRFCVLYAAIAIASGVALSGGAGVDVNVFFDADIALSLGIGVAVTKFSLPRKGVTAAALILSLGLGLDQASAGEDWRDPDFWLHPLRDEAATAGDDIRFLKSRNGPALCESLALCYWAGKKPEIDVFNVGQQFATSARSDGELVGQIEARRFAVIEFDSLSPFSLTPRVRGALLAAYRIDHSDDDGVFLVPRIRLGRP